MTSFTSRILERSAIFGRGRAFEAGGGGSGEAAPIHPLFPRNVALGKVNHVYRVVSLRSSGGMSVLYNVRDGNNQIHLLKIPDFSRCPNEPEIIKELRSRFRREVRILHAIHLTNILDPELAAHRSNVVRLIDWDPQWDPAEPQKALPRYYIMELIHGKDLAEAVRAGETQDPLNALKIIYKLALGLMVIGDVAAKIAGPAQGGQPVRFCHRDVKPENLRLRMEDNKVKQVVLMDPGIMKLEDKTEDTLTRTGHFRGTPDYSAPETVPDRSRFADQRSDIYVASAMLYELLTGRKHYNNDDARQRAIFFTEPEKLIRELKQEKYRPTYVGEDLWELVFHGMEADPNKRYRTYEEFATALYDMMLRYAG